jgi:uncharacterized protein
VASTTQYDCQHCGACCCNLDQNREIGYVDYVEVKRRDPLMRKPELREKLVVINDKGEFHMRLDHNQRCIALRGRVGRSVGCSIYEDRPAVCRKVKPGSEACIQAREERGVRS